ncbi:acetyl-CoA synthetase-like protein [Delitschia confertaspora ATCC 74209]|uniref:Acetyl-CoA synthetase-like protein n=1 Tax=Delitschia confertaspora ATCC 74209 TaxID=1513339 RepID=A0A9P4JKC4_9PLEO|nr:acetyl-CoA synthetase-like protein [Delitschia confertaspora ATCC 74209]
MATEHAQLSNWRNELTPNIVDHLAKVLPNSPYALYPISPVTYDDGYRTVTYKDFANAVNGLAWWLHDNLGPSKDFDVLAYIGPNDVRYTALILGAIKAGYVALFTSPRNSIPAHCELFEKSKCQTMLTPSPPPPAVEPLLAAYPMKHLQVPSVVDLLDTVHPHYPYNKTFDTARLEPFVVIHTSGSTGMPKPLFWTHETAVVHSRYIAQDPPPGFQALDRLFQGKRMLNTFPPFHGACIAIHLFNSVPFGTVSIAPLSGAIATAEGVVRALEKAPAETAFLVPSVVSELCQNPGLLEYCSQNLELILYAGGDLPQLVGDKIAAKVHFRCQYGASEVGLLCQLIAPDMTAADWRYVRYHPGQGLEFEEITPGMYELIVKRDPKYEAHQLPFTIGPDLQSLQVFRSRDLFVKHPTVSDCWGWRARADDIIVFLNGEKTNPVSMEQHIVASEDAVSYALVFGMQRFQAGLLVEPAAKLGELNQAETISFIDAIWPSIDEANEAAPAHARVEKSMVLLTTPDKPMIRSGKGTIQRAATIAQYTAEIDDLFLKADSAFDGAEGASVDTNDSKQVSELIQQAIAQVNPNLLQEETDNFFSLGMDSLMAVRLIRALRHRLGQPDLSVSIVHNNPSVQQLTQYIVGEEAVNDNGDVQKTSEMQVLLAEYEQMIAQIPARSHEAGETVEKSNKGEIVVLTGSTGSLGTHLLEALLENPSTSHVYCLNRRENAQEIQETKAKTTGFQLGQHSDRITFLHATLDQPNLGLAEETYEVLRSTTTSIIHNAWLVNFIMPLNTFCPQFDGLINLFKLAASRSDPPKLLYISSISSVGQLSHRSKSHSILEEVVRDLDASYGIGYAKSKLFSELLCDKAARCLDIPISFARVGQIAGPVTGETVGLWNVQEWLPSLILTSISMGAIPDSLGAELSKVDWVPVDILSRTLVELGLNQEESDRATKGALAFNLVNPQATSWKELLPCFVSSIETHSNEHIDVVPLKSWLDKLRTLSEGFSADAAELLAWINPLHNSLFQYHTIPRAGCYEGYGHSLLAARSTSEGSKNRLEDFAKRIPELQVKFNRK